MNTHPEHIGNQLTYLTDKELQRVLLQYQKIAGFDSTEKMLSHLKEVALCNQFDYLGQIDENRKNAWFDHFLDGDLAIKISSEEEYLAFYDYLLQHNVDLTIWEKEYYESQFPYFFIEDEEGMQATTDTEYLAHNYGILHVVHFSELGISEEKEDVDVDR